MSATLRRLLAALASAWTLGAATAGAQGLETPPTPPLGQQAVRGALLGYDLTGEVLGTGEVWRECIEPAGRTFWRFGDFESEGRLEVRADGLACFRYRHTDFQREVCWAMREDEGRLRFDLVNGASLPLVILARRRVASCVGDGPIA